MALQNDDCAENKPEHTDRKASDDAHVGASALALNSRLFEKQAVFGLLLEYRENALGTVRDQRIKFGKEPRRRKRAFPLNRGGGPGDGVWLLRLTRLLLLLWSGEVGLRTI